MTELAFARSFLNSLDGKPTRISPDHVEDPRTYPARSAVHSPPSHVTPLYTDRTQTILPKMPRAPIKRAKLAPGQERSLTITLKSLRNPPLTVTLSGQAPNTSILDLKVAVSKRAGVAVEKLRVLHNKKPVGDAKVLKEVVGETDTEAEFTIMVMGGAASVKGPEVKAATNTKTKGENEVEENAVMSEAVEAPEAQGVRKTHEAENEEFWEDLKGFLMKRGKDRPQSESMCRVFRLAWETT